jgi:hypothetical protein
MKGITIKLPEGLLRALAEEARASGRSIAAVVRSRLGQPGGAPHGSVHALASDLAGSQAGSTRSGTNERRRFRRQ